MTFEKPDDVRYVDMCIYIDDNAYREGADQSLIYEYLYHLAVMLSNKRAYFHKSKTIDEFGIYAASSYFMRLFNKKQFGENPSLEPIRSILNYMQKTLFAIRIDFCKKFVFDEIPMIDDSNLPVENIDDFRQCISRAIDGINRCEFKVCILEICEVIKDFLQYIPYKTDKVKWNNIYISCLLSFLNSCTLPNCEIQRINGYKRAESITDDLLEELYIREKYNTTILYHLESSMEGYITVLTNRIKRLLSKELTNVGVNYIPPYVNIKNLMVANAKEEDENWD